VTVVSFIEAVAALSKLSAEPGGTDAVDADTTKTISRVTAGAEQGRPAAADF
jgi:hypothetical protein